MSVYILLSNILLLKLASYYLRWGCSKALNDPDSIYGLFSEAEVRVKLDLIRIYLVKGAVRMGSVRVYIGGEG